MDVLINYDGLLNIEIQELTNNTKDVLNMFQGGITKEILERIGRIVQWGEIMNDKISKRHKKESKLTKVISYKCKSRFSSKLGKTF